MVPSSSTSSSENSTSRQRTFLGSFVHILALFTWVIGPAIVYIIANSNFSHENARNALNWQILFTIVPVIFLVLSFVIADEFVIIGALFVVIGGFLTIIFCLYATFRSIRGEIWEYPIAPEFV